jgi:hypothetical protein
VSALLEALYRGQTAQVEQLLTGDPELDVFEAAALGKTDRLRELLAEDATRANAFGDDGFHPLGLACFFGHVDSARLLLERGADINARCRAMSRSRPRLSMRPRPPKEKARTPATSW